MKLPSQKEFELLALLSDGREHAGRAVALRYKEETGRTISYGTLYTTFRRLRSAGWIDAREDEDQDGRVRYFRVVGAGERVLTRARAHYAAMATFPRLKAAT